EVRDRPAEREAAELQERCRDLRQHGHGTSLGHASGVGPFGSEARTARPSSSAVAATLQNTHGSCACSSPFARLMPNSEPSALIGRTVAAIRFRRCPASLTCLLLAALSSAAFAIA